MSKQPTSSTEHITADNLARMVMLTYGRMDDGKTPYWCYVAVKPSEYDHFNEILKAGRLNLKTFEQDGFGEIIVSGQGLYPPQDITRDVARLFNMPIKDMFGDVEPKSLISQKIEQLKQNMAKKPETDT